MFDFARFARENGIPTAEQGHHHCHQGWMQTHCPVCAGGGKGFHLGFSLTRGNFNCWRCGPMRTLDVVCMLLHITHDQAKKVVRQYRSSSNTSIQRAPSIPRHNKLRKKSISPPPFTEAVGKPHKIYLLHRHFSTHVINLWDIRGTRHLSGEWNWRIVYPIRNAKGVTVAWQGRSIKDDVKPKYRLTADEDCVEDPKSMIYGLDLVPGNGCIVVEGAPDVWRLGPGAVGMLGIDWTRGQASRLRQFERRYILFDPDKIAQKRAQQLADWLSLFPGETEIIEGLKTDPGDMTNKQAKRLKRELLGDGNE